MHHGIFTLPPLRNNKKYDAYAERHKRSDDSATIPCLRHATPLHSKDEAHDSTNNQSQASDIQLPENHAPAGPVLRWFVHKEEEDEDGR
jgi:hypothetical protein